MRQLSKVAGTGMLLAGLTVVPVLAQTTPAPDRPTEPSDSPSAMRSDMPRATDIADDDDFNFGWLGLLGLAGLAGIRRKTPVADRFNNERIKTDTDRI
jgi:MYXO-CTERM domain-containing protein